jgi:hypothetical protein
MYRAHLVAITSLQPDPAVDRPAASGELSVVVLDGDLVAEEPRRAGAGVGECGTPHPILQVPGSQHLADQPKQPVIVDLLPQRREHDLMVKLIEAPGDVALDKPGRSRPGVRHLAQRGVAPPAGPETVRAVGELRAPLHSQEGAHHTAGRAYRVHGGPPRPFRRSALRIPRGSSMSRHLCPFALRTALPSSLVGRDSGRVGPGRGAGVTAGPFPRPALRTGRAHS